MKDAYSFHDSPQSLDQVYKAMYDAYCRIFQQCGLNYVVVEAETGEMGGSGSHQFTVPCDSGEDVIVYTEDGAYAANLERADVDPLPKSTANHTIPAIEEVHTPGVGSIEAVCDFLKTRPEQMIKTLIYTINESTVAVLVRGDHAVNPEKLSPLFPGEPVTLAQADRIQRCTGAAVGFAGPVGLIEKVDRLIIDHAVAAMAVGITGANKTDYHLQHVVPGRDFDLDGTKVAVTDIRHACEGDTYQGKPLRFKKGIEVGQVFKLGTKYSTKLGATYQDENGKDNPSLMGCYGIGINRILASAIELGHDDNGIIWPISIAPYEVLITPLNPEDAEVSAVADRLYASLTEQGVDVLLDDRPLRAGVKFKDADLIGLPVRVTVGKRAVAEGHVEVKLRRESDSQHIDIDQSVDHILEVMASLKAELKVR